MSSSSPTNQKGVTLVELIIAIVIISIASLALLKSFGFQTRSNVDPVIQLQSQLLAKQYLEEVSGKSFFDPTADPRLDPTLTQAEVVASIIEQSQSGAPARMAWDNIGEYNGYSSNVIDTTGTPVPGLSDFNVSVAIDISSSLNLGSLSNHVDTSCPAQIAAITVTVTDGRGQSTSIVGYRTSYWQPLASWGCS